MNKKKYLWLIAIAIILTGFISWHNNSNQNKNIYENPENWAYFAIGNNKSADLFLIAPTVDIKDEFNMSLDDAKTKNKFIGSLNMERGIYEDFTRMYAPFYRQITLKGYHMDASEREKYLKIAYEDISRAFKYYLEHENNNRPFILAGFSQGADMCTRILNDYKNYRDFKNNLIAVYAIGWPCVLNDDNKNFEFAQSENDTGVIINFECEAPEVESTIIYPAELKAKTINPLSWEINDKLADKNLNLGACFTDYSGNIKSEINNFCGAYIDLNRGVIKIPGVNKSDYPTIINFLPDGAFHIYDYMFFYRNLQHNVKTRIENYFINHVQ